MDRTSDHSIAAAVRYWPLLFATVVLAASVLGFAAKTQPTSWSSAAEVLYGGDSSGLLSGASRTDTDVQRTLATQTQVVLSDPVIRQSASDLKLSMKELLDRTTVKDLPDSNVITISVTGPTAAKSAFRTERVAASYVSYTRSVARRNLTRQAAALRPSIERLRKQLKTAAHSDRASSAPISTALSALEQRQSQLVSAAGAEQGAASMISAPQLSTRPSSISILTATVVGAAIGLVLGAGLILALNWLPFVARPDRWRPTAGNGPKG